MHANNQWKYNLSFPQSNALIFYIFLLVISWYISVHQSLFLLDNVYLSNKKLTKKYVLYVLCWKSKVKKTGIKLWVKRTHYIGNTIF